MRGAPAPLLSRAKQRPLQCLHEFFIRIDRRGGLRIHHLTQHLLRAYHRHPQILLNRQHDLGKRRAGIHALVLHHPQHGVRIVNRAIPHRITQPCVKVAFLPHAESIHVQPLLTVNRLHPKRRAVPQRHAAYLHRPVRPHKLRRIGIRIKLFTRRHGLAVQSQHLHAVHLPVIGLDHHHVTGLHLMRLDVDRPLGRAALKLHPLRFQALKMRLLFILHRGGTALLLGLVAVDHVLDLARQHLSCHILSRHAGEIPQAMQLLQRLVQRAAVAVLEHQPRVKARDFRLLDVIPVADFAPVLAVLRHARQPALGRARDAAMVAIDPHHHVFLAGVWVRNRRHPSNRILSRIAQRTLPLGPHIHLSIRRHGHRLFIFIHRLRFGLHLRLLGLGAFRRLHIIQLLFLQTQPCLLRLAHHRLGRRQPVFPQLAQLLRQLLHLAPHKVHVPTQHQIHPLQQPHVTDRRIFTRERPLPDHPTGFKVQHVGLVIGQFHRRLGRHAAVLDPHREVLLPRRVKHPRLRGMDGLGQINRLAPTHHHQVGPVLPLFIQRALEFRIRDATRLRKRRRVHQQFHARGPSLRIVAGHLRRQSTTRQTAIGHDPHTLKQPPKLGVNQLLHLVEALHHTLDPLRCRFLARLRQPLGSRLHLRNHLPLRLLPVTALNQRRTEWSAGTPARSGLRNGNLLRTGSASLQLAPALVSGSGQCSTGFSRFRLPHHRLLPARLRLELPTHHPARHLGRVPLKPFRLHRLVKRRVNHLHLILRAHHAHALHHPTRRLQRLLTTQPPTRQLRTDLIHPRLHHRIKRRLRTGSASLQLALVSGLRQYCSTGLSRF